MENTLKDRTILITGITDASSLALKIAIECKNQGATLVCTGLGRTPFHENISDNGKAYLEKTYNDFLSAVHTHLGKETKTFTLDVSIQASIDDLVKTLQSQNLKFDGLLHSIAMDKTIRAGKVKPILDITREEFADAMNVSAFSLLAITQGFYKGGLLNDGSSIVALSYLGAERIVAHPYKNIGVAKAALERLVKEMAMELGKSNGIQVNAVRFSPYTASKAGGAIEGLTEAVQDANNKAPLGNARPEDLAAEVVYLFRKNNRITGDIRHVDGGFNIRG